MRMAAKIAEARWPEPDVTTCGHDGTVFPSTHGMQNQPEPAREYEAIAAPRDVPFPGTIFLQVDATDTERAIFQVRELIPVSQPGRLTLLYPKWLPGYHSPEGAISLLAGLEISAGGRSIEWRRDEVEVHAFHVEVPQGVERLELSFQFVSPTSPLQGRVVVTPDVGNLEWYAVLLYPAGYYARQIQVQATLTLPEEWELACALQSSSRDGATRSFEPVPLDVLVDSPVLAGRYFRSIELDERGEVRLNVVADRADLLPTKPEHIEPHRALVAQADKLFGARHFDRFEFLVALSDELGGIGVEHHRSCEIGTAADYFSGWENNAGLRDVMAHEYTHSWNGKYRRGADSWTANFDRPIRNSLMWVYEGQTQYWGNVLSARSGLWTREQALDAIARTAAIYENRAGRRWRPISDTTRDPVIASRKPLPWVSWQRSEDYYSEGQLIWLEIDTLIRELSGDERSLDNFARAFFGGDDGSYRTSTYDFDEVVSTLESIASYDWAGYLREKLEQRQPDAPLEGLGRGGYRLVYRDTPNAFAQQSDNLLQVRCLRFSIGVSVGDNGRLHEVLWDSPAFHAGLTAGADVLAVNGRAYSGAEIEQAVIAAQDGAPLELLVKKGKRLRLVPLAYRDGLRYPRLEPIEGARRRLDEIFAPR
jgi:predicted metalloprotease with PDZ domain